jgi:chemosensory pili system protein ChpA (sensor histidine kinase/response regulator)
MRSEFDRQNLIGIFVAEASEAMDSLSKALHLPDGKTPTPIQLQEQYVWAHKIRGASVLYGYVGLALMGTLIESTLEEARSIEESQWPKALEILRGMVNSFESQLTVIASGGAEDLSISARWKDEVSGLFPVLSAAVPPETALLTPDYLVPALDAEVLSYFVPEAQEYLEALESQLLRLEKGHHSPEVIDQLFRTTHTLKGSAYTVGFQSIGDLTHYVEDFIGTVREERVKIHPEQTDVLLRSIDVVRLLMRRSPRSLDLLRRRFIVAMQELKQLNQSTTTEVVEPGSVAAGVKISNNSDVIRVSRDRLERLMNLIGELAIGRGRIEQRLCTLEQHAQQVLACKDQLVESVHTFEEKHTSTLPTASSGPVPDLAHGVTSHDDSGSIKLDRYDDFNRLALSLRVVTSDMSESVTQLNESIRRSHEDMSHLAQLTLDMRDEIDRTRRVPIGTPFTRFHRATREMARATGKEVRLVTSGDQTEVDTAVVERLVDPLIHLVRNAVYHGIEPASIRASKGKSAAGTIYLHALHRGNALLIEVEDDGAGLDVEKIRAKAIERGLISSEVACSMSESEVVKFIFVPGFSTADKIDNQAGRGVGMDVVKRAVESMNGHIDVESVRDVGTKFTLSLPLTLLFSTVSLDRRFLDYTKVRGQDVRISRV